MSRPKIYQEKWYSSHDHQFMVDNSTGIPRFHICRTSAVKTLSDKLKQDIYRQEKTQYFEVRNTYYIEARIENYFTIGDLYEDIQPIESIKAFNSFRIITSNPALSHYMLQSYLDITKYISHLGELK